jgi:hypothetical protein
MRTGFIAVLFMFGCASAPSASSHPNDPADHGDLDLEYDESADTLDNEPADSPGTIRLMAVGDIMLGSTYPHTDGRDLPVIESPAGLMAPFAELLRLADLTIGNLEGVLAAHDEPGTRPKCHHAAKGCFAFRMPPELGAHLVAAGFDVLSLANNHILDFGEKARAATQRHLDALGIKHTGKRGEIARLVVGGRRVSVIGMSVYDHSYDLNDLAEATAVIAAEAASADIVVVSIHAGGEGPDYMRVPHGPERFLGRNRGDLRLFSRAAIDAGADLIVGHGPHVPRAIELYKGRLVAYSLGNFATWKRFNLAGPNGLGFILDVRLDVDGAFVSGKAIPFRQLGLGGPVPDPEATALPILARLSREDFPETGVVVTADGTILRPVDPNADVAVDPLPAPALPPSPQSPQSPATEPPGARHLDKLHPHLRHLAFELHRRAIAAGVPFRIIHGYATYKPRKAMGPGGMANWHQFGLAFDILIADRKSITDGKNHFAVDDPQWQVLGTIAAELGLVWGGSWRSSYDPFHFEWHPGDDPVINPADLRRLLAKAGPDGRDLEAVWTLYPAPRDTGDTGSTQGPTVVSDP